MKRTFTILFSILLAAFAYAQPSGNYIFTDCNGNSKNLYNILGTGKAVIVLHKGVDCSICVNSAPGWQTFAAANTAAVEVIGTLTYTYNPNNFNSSNMCSKTATWVTTHGWTNIFTAPDSNRVWYRFGSPRYYVYSPSDSSIVYQGSSAATARNTALAQSTVGLASIALNESQVHYANGNLNIKNVDASISSVAIYSTNGQLILEESISTDERSTLDVSQYNKGVYVVQLRGRQGEFDNRKVLFF